MPIRTCVGCRATAAKRDLVRVVCRNGEFIVDAAQREPGRGAYLHPECAQTAIRTRGVQRTLKVPATPSTQLDAILSALAASV